MYSSLSSSITPRGRLTPHAAVYALPAEIDLLDRSVDQGLGLQSQQTAQVLCPLKVAAHPVESLRAA